MESPAPSPLSETTHREIAALVRQISVAHHLDPDIRAELAAHIEDKLAAYLDGSEKPSEADALLLAKSHFGNPATLKSFFHQAHPTAHDVSLFRKLAALTIATAVAYIVGTILLLLVDFVAYCNYGDTPGDSSLADIQQNLSQIFNPLVIPSLLAIPLLVWHWQAQRVRPPWFEKVRPIKLTLGVAATLALVLAFQHCLNGGFSFIIDSGRISMPLFHFKQWAFPSFLVSFFFQIGEPLTLWLWWCDRTPRQWRSLLPTLCAYLLFRITFLDGIAVSPFDRVFYRSTLHFFSIAPAAFLRNYLALELPGILFAFLLFLLLPRHRKPQLAA